MTFNVIPMGEPRTLAEELDELFTVMRKHGCLKFTGPVGGALTVEVILDPHHGQRLVVADEPDDPLDEEVKSEERRSEILESRLRREWSDHWRRMTGSSGGSIMPFPGVDAAQRYFARGAQ